MDRKYRQRGYQDSSRDRTEPRNGQRTQRTELFGPRTPQFPSTRNVVRCAGCGTVLSSQGAEGLDSQGRCPKCGAEIHSCRQCAFFNTEARFECTQPLTIRIPRKDIKNDCKYYAPRTTVERQTTSVGPVDPRQAFENLFKK